MLVNSIPLSCNQALERLLASGRDLTRVGTIGDLCQTYCLFPLSQAAQGCPEITNVYEIISRACCKDGMGQRSAKWFQFQSPLVCHRRYTPPVGALTYSHWWYLSLSTATSPLTLPYAVRTVQ